MQHHMRASRRSLIGLAAMALPAHAAFAQEATALPQTTGDPIAAPAWSFQLITLQDPYADILQVPQEVPAGNGVIAIEVEIINDSNQALAFTPIDVRLRDAAGSEYRGGAAIGAEPMINPRNLNPGERSRGWVWFIVPEATDLAEVVYIAPQPEFRVPV